MSTVSIAGRLIGAGCPCFVVAEAGVNHNGDLRIALQLIDAAASCGADAVKFQTFNTDRLVVRNAPKAPYQIETTPETESQFEMLRRLELPIEAYPQLRARCDERGIVFLSTPYDELSIDLLVSLNVPAIKIASCDLTNWPLLEHAARTGLPILLATGMGTLVEVGDAMDVLSRANARQVVLLHCVSNYPAQPASVNLKAMDTMREEFDVPVGFSDHTSGTTVAVAAVARGAVLLEKHFTLDRGMSGPDHRASLDPGEFRRLVEDVRIAESALGDGVKRRMPEEEGTARAARRSLVSARSLLAGTQLSRSDVEVKRPGTGLPPSALATLLGRRVRADVPPGVMLDWTMFDAE